MALSITVNGGGTFSASMEEGPVSFTATLGAVPGPKGDTGATGPTGVIAATAPIIYDSGTQTVSIDTDPDFNSVTTGSTQMSTAGIQFPDATLQTTAFVGEARKEYIIARNDTGSTIAKGKVVYLSGATGNKPTMALAQANTEATSARTIGILIEATANNADGKVIISGAAEGIDTSAFNAGEVVYLSSSVAGGLQTTLPAAPLHGVVVGIVTRANPSVGSIEVFIQNYQELSELSDVNVSDKANNDGLFWESSSSTWRSKTIAEVLGLTPIALTSLSASAPIAYNSGTGAFTFDSSGFLLKADNLSGLASASTARTNLGLGSAALSSTSDFAAAVHTHTASAITDFSTAVDALVPAASTTTAGKVELATEAEALTKTSTTVALTPSNAVRLLANSNLQRFHYFTPDTATNGTGGLNDSIVGGYGRRTNGPTSSGAGHVRAGMLHLQRGGSSASGIDWSRVVRVGARIVRTNTNTTNESIYRLSFGETQATNTGDLPNRGIGIKITGSGVVTIMAHDGTNLTTSATSFTPSVSQAFDLILVSSGSGTVECFVNGSSVGSTTGGPTTAASANQNYLNVRVENTSSFTASPQQFQTFNMTAEVVYT